MSHAPPRPKLFPYTTLFRSRHKVSRFAVCLAKPPLGSPHSGAEPLRSGTRPLGSGMAPAHSGTPPFRSGRGPSRSRSEEHTSELQSHVNLVCRLLLEKKKNM